MPFRFMKNCSCQPFFKTSEDASPDVMMPRVQSFLCKGYSTSVCTSFRCVYLYLFAGLQGVRQ